ncbi:hypothetical protein Ahy_B08g089304 [Arachis hypogaea]|uniref:Uncharacterized protein n=1 Tax=Arachis hypogaea TaxID=3818 RepID=A0A444XXP8_ARAHY|nr:hypothetical protein Ahy_B08g089304 [Arachis hypogaea]
MSPNKFPADRGSPPQPLRQTPLQIIHVAANFMRIWSIYSMYRYLTQSGALGRLLSNTQVVPSIINGAITALYFVLWEKGLRSCGPVRAILSEYSGDVREVLSALLYGRRSNLWKKVKLSYCNIHRYIIQMCPHDASK